jgi:hypothetical protein
MLKCKLEELKTFVSSHTIVIKVDDTTYII